jgi:hypothetical protein
MASFKKFITPRCEAQWAFLAFPQTKFNPDGVYAVNMLFDADSEDWKKLKEKIDELVDIAFEEKTKGMKPGVRKQFKKHYPYQDQLDDESGEPTGKIIIKAKKDAVFKNKKGETIKFKPRLFDAKGKKLKAGNNFIVPNGSIIKVQVYPSAFDMAANKIAGITLKLEAAQIIELAEMSGGFGEEEGSFDADEFMNENGDDDFGNEADNNNGEDESYNPDGDF